MQLSDIPNWVKTGAIIMGAAIATHQYFQTDAEAAQAHNDLARVLERHIEIEAEKFKQDRLDRAEREIKRLQLRLAEEKDALPEEVKQRLREDIKEYQDLKTCIRNDKC